MKIIDSSYSIGRGFSVIRDNPHGWTEGIVKTPHGIVEVYAQGDTQHRHNTRLSLVHQRRCYIREFPSKRLSHRSITRQARAFAKEITNQS